MSHIVLCFSNDSFGNSYPQANRAAQLFYSSFIDNYIQQFDSSLSKIITNADENSFENKLRICRANWDKRKSPENEDCLICTFSCHACGSGAELKILSNLLNLKEIDVLFDRYNFPKVAVILDCCSYNTPRIPENFTWMKSKRMYTDAVNNEGIAFGTKRASAFSETFSFYAEELSVNYFEVSLDKLLDEVAVHLKKISTKGKGNIYCYTQVRRPFSCILKPAKKFIREDSFNKFYKIISDKLINELYQYGKSITPENFSFLNDLPKSNIIAILQDSCSKILENGYLSLDILLILFSKIIKPINICRSDKIKLLVHLRNNTEFNDEWLFRFLEEEIINLNDILFLAEVSGQQNSSVAKLLLLCSIWDGAYLVTVNEEMKSKLSKIYIRALKFSLSAAMDVPVDVEYEFGMSYIEMLGRYLGTEMVDRLYELKADYNSGSGVLEKTLKLLFTFNSPLNNLQRFKYLSKLTLRFSYGRHWGMAYKCFKLLTNTKLWLDEDYSIIFYPKDISDNIDPYDHIKRKYYKIKQIMIKNKTPMRWQLLLSLCFYEFYYGEYDMYAEGNLNIITKIIKNINRMVEEHINELETIDVSFDDIDLVNRAHDYIFLVSNGKMTLNRNSLIWKFDQNLKNVDYKASLNVQVFDRLSIHFNLLHDAIELEDKRRINFATHKLLDGAKNEYYFIKNKHSYALDYYMKDLDHLIRTIDKIYESKLLEIDDTIKKKVGKIINIKKKYTNKLS